MSAAKSQNLFFRVHGPGLNRQLRDFVHEGRIDLAIRIVKDSGVPVEYLKKIVQGKVKIINTDDPKILALTDEGEMPPDLTSEIIRYALPHWDEATLKLAEQAMDLPPLVGEYRLDTYERCFREPNNMPWCWITARGRFLPCGFQGHLAKIDELKERKLISENEEERDIEKKWVKVTLSGIYMVGALNAQQQLALKKLLSVPGFKHHFFDEKETTGTFISTRNCHGAYIDANGNVKLNIGRDNGADT